MVPSDPAFREVRPGLFHLPLPLPAPGFSSFICSWLYKYGNICFLADPGPSSSVPALLSALRRLDVHSLDFLLLTHIHLDHAGGTGDFLSAFGPCPVVCHESAARHLADPARLWEGSVKTLGDLARSYGRPAPVDKGLIRDAAGFSEAGVRPIATPGHAPHHVSYLAGDILLAGETGGVCLDLGGGRFYLRPATPPRFFFETHVESLEALLRTPHLLYCYGHCGAVESGLGLLARHREQLFFWRETIAAAAKDEPEEKKVDACLARLLETDGLLAGFAELSVGERERERYFLKNSIRGFLGYLADREKA